MKIDEPPTRARRRRSLSDEVMCGGVAMSMEVSFENHVYGSPMPKPPSECS